MIKKLRICCLVLVLSFAILIPFGKSTIKSLGYDEFSQSAVYTFRPIDEWYADHDYLKNIIIDDRVSSYNDLLANSPYVLLVSVENTRLEGEGIINECKVKKVIKGKNINTDDLVMIYDHASAITPYAATYIEGTRPMKENDNYIVFIDDAPNPNVEGAYLFSSFKYGSFRISESAKYLYDYNSSNEITISEAMEYDYIGTSEDVDLYNKLFIEINTLSK